ncbi:MAG TPA: hypothetical protein VF037_04070 [Gemmatimonadales bacterium]
MQIRFAGRWAGRIGAAMALLVAGACESTGPEEVPEDELTIVTLAAASPPLESTVLQFYAVRGEDREGALYFQDESGERGERFLELRFRDESLLTGPGGLPIAPGDSLLITITVVDESKILFDFQPSGVVFNPAEMPELRIRYAEAEDDFDDDGDVDDDDAEIEGRLAIWRQEALGLPFFRLGSVRFEDIDEIEAELPGFTRYAIAY